MCSSPPTNIIHLFNEPSSDSTTAVTELNSLDSTSSGGGGTSLTIGKCSSILDDAQLGDSVSVNGTCLTITEFNNKGDESSWYFKIGAAPETLRRTNLGNLSKASEVNLERAVSASTRMGGHFVQGHVDTIANIESVTPDGNAKTFRLKPRQHEGSQSVLRYIVEKGYVTLDGASLTVTKVNDEEGWFEIMLIAYTQEKVVTASKKAGDQVNVEVDQVGKYVEKSVVGYLEQGESGAPAILEKLVSRMVEEKLQASSNQ